MTDVLTEVLSTSRVSGTIFCRGRFTSPWSVSVDEVAPCGYFHIVERGACILQLAGTGDRIFPMQGDVVLLPRGAGHRLSDTPQKSAVRFIELLGQGALGPMTELQYGGGGAETSLLSGAYEYEPGAPSQILSSLPAVIHLPATVTASTLGLHSALHLLAAEIAGKRAGYRLIADRLVEMVFFYVLRTWLETLPAGAGGWLAALRDPQIGQALCLMHGDYSRRWTVAELACSVGMSRATFAREFKALIDESPLAYLTKLRLEAGAQLLGASDETIFGIAARVGYESEYSFGKAFKREFGQSPGRYRDHKRTRLRSYARMPDHS
jgi:AraC-like DNA-binding protein